LEKDPAWLLQFSRDHYSQAGEDGIIEQILALLPANDRWCVEFGAWDGLHLSNSRHLIENSGYSAVLIEGSSSAAADLQRNLRHPRVMPATRFRVHGGWARALLAKHHPADFTTAVDRRWQWLDRVRRSRYRPKVMSNE
jgi:hypothetical protein